MLSWMLKQFWSQGLPFSHRPRREKERKTLGNSPSFVNSLGSSLILIPVDAVFMCNSDASQCTKVGCKVSSNNFWTSRKVCRLKNIYSILAEGSLAQGNLISPRKIFCRVIHLGRKSELLFGNPFPILKSSEAVVGRDQDLGGHLWGARGLVRGRGRFQEREVLVLWANKVVFWGGSQLGRKLCYCQNYFPVLFQLKRANFESS